jgi:putative drug exporter of the RND superfamily
VADSKPPPGVKAYDAGRGALTADTIVVGNASLARMTIITIIIAIMLMFVYRSVGTVLLTMVILFVDSTSKIDFEVRRQGFEPRTR